MKRPNLFIIGAPKCGTSSLAVWLGEHPRIFMCDPKEPGYFDSDLGKCIYNAKRYESLFSKADERHIAIAEASTGYLRSGVAVNKIMAYNADAKFIVCVRNPVDMALSWYGQKVREGDEVIANFEDAWRIQEYRREGFHIPKLCLDPSGLIYADVCRIGEQLSRLLRIVPRERVHIIVLDDLRNSPSSVYRKVMEFLGVPDDGRNVFPVINQARRIPYWLSATRALVQKVKAATGIRASLGLLRDNGLLDQAFTRPEHLSISPSLREELVNYFRHDINILENILKRDLSDWYLFSKQDEKY